MFDGVTDDDDCYFTPVASSNLASLFGVSVTKPELSSGNTSLTYTAPKQPQKTDDAAKNTSTSKHKSSVIVFKEIHAFKIVDKNPLDQRKCGLALIGNDTVHIYQLLLYKQKNDIISSTKISKQFQFAILNDNCSSFCDDQKQNWTVNFNSELDLNEFCSTLESRGAKIVRNEKDTSEVSNSTIKQPLAKDIVNKDSPKQTDSDNQSDTSSSNVKANILSRMAKMGQKLLPNTSVSDGTDSDTEREKSLQSKNRKVKRNTTSSTNIATEIAKKPPVNLPPSRTNTMLTQPCIQPHYSIINGIPVIQPMYGPISSEPNLSQTQYTPLPTEANTNTSCHSMLPVEGVSSPIMYNPLIPPPYDQLQMYFTENRTHNSEVRMNILRLTNKMEEVLEKVQKRETNNISTDRENILKDENDTLKSRITKLENDLQKNKEEQQEQRDEFTKKQEKLSKENDELQKNVLQYKDNEKEYKEKIEHLQLQIQKQEASFEKTQADGDKTNEMNDKVEECVKRLMNNLYFEINAQIHDEESVLGKDVKSVLAQKIRDNTYSIISAVNELSLSK